MATLTEIRKIVTTEPGIIRVNGEAIFATALTGAAIGHVVEAIDEIVDNNDCTVVEAGQLFIDGMRAADIDNVAVFGVWWTNAPMVFAVIDDNKAAKMLAPNSPVDGSMLATKNGNCGKTGWPIVAGVHHIINTRIGNRTGWVRTDKLN